MSVWHVVVETVTDDGTVDQYDAVVLAHTERSARSLATRAVAKHNLTGAHSIEATMLDHRETGALLITKRGIDAPLHKKESVWA